MKPNTRRHKSKQLYPLLRIGKKGRSLVNNNEKEIYQYLPIRHAFRALK